MENLDHTTHFFLTCSNCEEKYCYLCESGCPSCGNGRKANLEMDECFGNYNFND